MKHLIVRGRPGVGKSTLLGKLIEGCSLPICGFMTKKTVDADKTIEIYIHAASTAPEDRTYGKENLLARWEKGTDRVVFTETFDTMGVRLLEEQNETGFLVMDELGFLEKNAFVFQEAVLKALDGKLPVLAAIKDKDNDFLLKVAAHPRCEVFDITKENRDELFVTLSKKLAG